MFRNPMILLAALILVAVFAGAAFAATATRAAAFGASRHPGQDFNFFKSSLSPTSVWPSELTMYSLPFTKIGPPQSPRCEQNSFIVPSFGLTGFWKEGQVAPTLFRYSRYVPLRGPSYAPPTKPASRPMFLNIAILPGV